MIAHMVTVRDPFHPAASREIREIADVCTLRDLAPATDHPFIILRNGAAILRADWDQPVSDGDLLAVVLLPQGGGDGGSNPLRMIMMMAVSMFAPQIGMLAYESAVGATAITSMGATMAGIAGTFAGMALINALVPPPKPPSTMQAAALAAASPTYNIQAQGNTGRLDAAIPVGYGRLRVFPDFAAQPYIDYAGNEQYLYQLLCLGQGEYAVEAVQIDDTPVTSWAEVDYEIIPPGGAITKYPANVTSSIEVSGQECVGARAATYTQSGTTITVTLTAHGLLPGNGVYCDFTSGAGADAAFDVATAPTADTFTLIDTVSRTTSGNVTVQTYIGYFVASAAGTAANTIGLDVACPRGLYSYDTGSGALNSKSLSFMSEGRPINDSGTPTGPWATLGTESIVDATTTPQRYSYRYSVTAGRYQVRVRRTDTKDTTSTVGHELDWIGLRAYLPETRSYGSVTLLAMRMRASNNLSMQASRKINVIATRKLSIWNGTTWSAPTATRSITWAFADACRNTTYGAGLADSSIDLSALLALDAIWSARGDSFDGRFDGAISLWEALGKIAQAGRAKPYLQGGVVRISRDQMQTVPVALFSMRNILRNSFGIDYLMPTDATADAIDVGYFDGDVWAPLRVQAKLPGSTAAKPVKIDLFGVSSRDQAYREGMYQAASNRYRRKIIKFSAEMEGFIPSFGDLIAVQHDMVAWGQHAEVTAWNSGTRTLTLSEPMVWGSGTHYIGLRKRDGSIDGPYAVTAGATAYQVVLATSPGITPYTGGSEERTHIAFGWGETWRQRAKVIGITPRGLYQVDIQAVAEDDNVHTADVGIITPTPSSSQLDTLYTAPSVSGLSIRSSPSDNAKALLSWTPAPGADRYLIELSSASTPSGAWTRVADTTATNYATTAIYGAQTWCRVRAVGLTAGPWVYALYGMSADYFWAPSTDPMWTPSTNLMWA